MRLHQSKLDNQHNPLPMAFHELITIDHGEGGVDLKRSAHKKKLAWKLKKKTKTKKNHNKANLTIMTLIIKGFSSSNSISSSSLVLPLRSGPPEPWSGAVLWLGAQPASLARPPAQ